MKWIYAVISALFGVVSLSIISGMQASVYMKMHIEKISDLTPSVYAIGTSTKFLGLTIAVVGIIAGIMYNKSELKKLKLINYVGIFMCSFAIVLSIFPIYRLFL